MASFLFLRAALATSLISCAFALALPFSTRQTSSSPSVTLGSTVVTGSAQTFDGVGVDFFGGGQLHPPARTEPERKHRYPLRGASGGVAAVHAARCQRLVWLLL